jgi:divalent metal cation (Fe/Co/Zn/Cd) transporter
MTMRLSPEEVLVAARVDLADHLSPEQIERAADEIDDAVKGRFPEVRHLFLDPTPDPRLDPTLGHGEASPR